MQILLFCNSICRIFLRRKSLSFNSVYDWLGFSNQLPEDQSKFHLKPIKGVSKCTRIIFGEERGNFFKHVNEEITVTPLIRTLRGAQKVSVLMGCPYYKRPGGGVKRALTVKRSLEKWYCTFSDPVPYFVIWLNPQTGEMKRILSFDWVLDWAIWAIHHFHIDHNAPCLTPKSLETTVIPRRNWKQW